MVVGEGFFPDQSQPDIARRARAWPFTTRTAQSQTLQQNLASAGAFLAANQKAIYGGPVNEIQLALSAIRVRTLFEGTSQPDLDSVRAALQP